MTIDSDLSDDEHRRLAAEMYERWQAGEKKCRRQTWSATPLGEDPKLVLPGILHRSGQVEPDLAGYAL